MTISLGDRVGRSLHSLGVDPDEPVGVACSGGADSVALLHLIAGRRPVVALHVDHGLRASSAADAEFVSSLAEGLRIDFAAERVRIEPTGSVEAAARAARYDALAAMADARSIRHVATAHTLDDQAETVLLRVMRGGSADAIAPRRGMFVRPLLDTRRAELRAWLEERGIVWREDSSNSDLRFERNWVRHVLMPQLRERRAGVDIALAGSADHARTDRRALDDIAAGIFARAQVDDVGVFVRAADLDGVPDAVALRVLRLALRRLGVEAGAAEVRELHARGAARTRCGSVEVCRTPSGIAFIEPPRVPSAIRLPASGTVEDADRGLRLRVGCDDRPAWRWRVAVPAGPAAPAGPGLELRSRRPGDRIGSKKVQDLLVDAKVPGPLRCLVGIVASDAGALAVVGHTRGRTAASGSTVLDVEPTSASWSRKMLWSLR